MIHHLACLVAAVVLHASPSLAQQAEAPGAVTDMLLFSSHDVLTFTIKAPLKQIMKQRGQESKESHGTLALEQPRGDTISLNIKIRTRGKTRLEKTVCRFPPLRLNFQKDSVAATVFEGQDKLKLVTHCQDNSEAYEQYVLLEYLAYRTYNLLTDYSFRVRLARITYDDTESDRAPVTAYGFLIEDKDILAARNGVDFLEVLDVPINLVDADHLALIGVFQYFIGNTDWSAFRPEPDKDECCHNTKPIGKPGGPVYSVPYDFDMSGLINTRYAYQLYKANLEMMGLHSIRERLYRGLCRSHPDLPTVFDLFKEKREEIYDLYRRQNDLEEKVLKKTLKYFDAFYKVINDEGKTRRAFRDGCRG